MADAEQLARLRRSVEEWNEWRQKNPEIHVDLGEVDLRGEDLTAKGYVDDIEVTISAYLSGADLHRANLSRAVMLGAVLDEANLSQAKLSQADLSQANLSQANLRSAFLYGAGLNRANLSRADLSRASLTEANFDRADLSGANLSGADLSGAVLHGAHLRGTNLSGVKLLRTILSDINLKDVLGLETCIHHGPSTIDHRTLAKSWPLPEIFLRGCGLPNALITYLPSLVSDGAIQFYSCFISYSTKDQEFADRLYADLQNKGVRCWFAPHDVKGGRKLHEQLDEAIRQYERLLLILSPDSMASKWVKTEIRNARKRELAEKKRVLFPVRLASYEALRDWKLFDADEGEDLATEIQEYYIPDFTQWKSHDSYQKEFEKLLRDLRMDGAK